MPKKPYAPKNNKPEQRNHSGTKKSGRAPQNKHRVAIDKQVKDPQSGMRLNKFIANAGVCSRREADIYIASGNVTVNGQVITEMGYQVKLTDDVRFDGRRISPEKKVYVLLNKPSGFYVTGNFEKNNRTVMDLVAGASTSRIAPVGSFETNSKGLLLLTNDGTLQKSLTRKPVRQIFEVELSKPLKKADLEEMREGIRLKEGLVKPKTIDYVEHKPKNFIGIELIAAIPQVVQKIFTKKDYEIINLDRVVYGGLTKASLPRGQYRHLNKQEIINLGML